MGTCGMPFVAPLLEEANGTVLLPVEGALEHNTARNLSTRNLESSSTWTGSRDDAHTVSCQFRSASVGSENGPSYMFPAWESSVGLHRSWRT